MKDVGGTTVITTIKEETKWLKRAKNARSIEKVDATKAYSVEEAVALAKDTNIAKFDATVEVAYKLNVDPKKQTNKSVEQLCFQTELVKHKLF